MITKMQFRSISTGQLCIGELGIKPLGGAYGHERTAAVIIGLHS